MRQVHKIYRLSYQTSDVRNEGAPSGEEKVGKHPTRYLKRSLHKEGEVHQADSTLIYVIWCIRCILSSFSSNLSSLLDPEFSTTFYLPNNLFHYLYLLSFVE